MVGVKRSLGCRECRRKKKGCDLVRPTCAICARTGRICIYETKQWTFKQGIKIPETNSKSDSLVSTTSVSLFLRNAYDSQIIARFWDLYLPADPSGTNIIDGLYGCPWSTSVRRLAERDKFVHLAARTCALMAVGRLDSNDDLVHESWLSYGRALLETNAALRDKQKSQSDSMLAACKLLAIYENLRAEHGATMSSQARDYHRHLDGISRLVELRGPQRHRADEGFDLLGDFRVSIAIASLVRKRRSKFSQQPWTTIPWDTRRKDVRDELTDLTLRLPELLERDVHISQMPPPMTRQDNWHYLQCSIKLQYDFLDLHNLLLAWEDKVRHLCRPASPTTATSALPCLAREITLHGHGFFNTVHRYWMTQLLLSATSHLHQTRLHKLTLAHPEYTTVCIPLLPPTLSPATYATLIARTVHYAIQPNAGLWAAQVLMQSAGAALHYFAATGQSECFEARTLQTAMSATREVRLLAPFMRGMAAEGAVERGAERVDDAGEGEGVGGEYKVQAARWFGMKMEER